MIAPVISPLTDNVALAYVRGFMRGQKRGAMDSGLCVNITNDGCMCAAACFFEPYDAEKHSNGTLQLTLLEHGMTKSLSAALIQAHDDAAQYRSGDFVESFEQLVGERLGKQLQPIASPGLTDDVALAYVRGFMRGQKRGAFDDDACVNITNDGCMCGVACFFDAHTARTLGNAVLREKLHAYGVSEGVTLGIVSAHDRAAEGNPADYIVNFEAYLRKHTC